MNIKSLLLGSAAALLAVSAARAADAVVVAEPEPAEYVKICDVYGAGYFYIPGTETCLRVGGYVRVQASGGEAGSFNGRATTDARTGVARRSYSTLSRLSLRTWTGSETEMGTLKTYTESRFNFANGGTSGVTLNFAYIQLGGLRVGLDESVFDTFTGYAGNVINDTLVPYGGFATNLVSYYFDGGNGFSAVVSLEQGNNGYSLITTPGGMAAGFVPPASWGLTANPTINVIDSYMPHVVGGVKYTQGWGSVSAVAAYNSNFNEWAGKVRLDVKATDQLTLFLMGGYGSDKNVDRNFYKAWGGNWAVWGGGSYQINEKTSLNAQLSYDDDKNFGAAANIAYDIVPGLTITAELDYINSGVSNWTGVPVAGNDAIGGIVRFQRSF